MGKREAEDEQDRDGKPEPEEDKPGEEEPPVPPPGKKSRESQDTLRRREEWFRKRTS